MAQAWSLSKRQLLFVLASSAIFPIANLLGGAVMTAGLFITAPFLPLVWIGGMLAVSVTGTENAYLLGAFLTILVQVWLVAVIRISIKGKKNAQPT